MRPLSLAALFLAGLVGCGGGNDSGGVSLQQQYQQALKTTDARSRAIRLIQIAYKQQNAGDLQGAQTSVGAAANAAREIANANEKAETLASVAYAAGAVGWITEASSLAKETRGAIEKADDPTIAASATAKMAVVYGKFLDNATAAETYLKQAEEVAGKIETPDQRATALLAVAGRRHEVAHTDEAQRVADAALEAIRTLEDPRRRADLLGEAAEQYHKIGQTDQAITLLDEAEAAVDAIEKNLVSQSYALLNLAERCHAVGQKDRAARTFKKAEDTAYKIAEQGEKDPVLQRLNKQRDKLL